MTRSGREAYLRKTLKALRTEKVDTLLWANGLVAEDVKQGHVYVHEHPFNAGQHVAHNEMLDACAPLNADYHIRVDDDCFISNKKWLTRLLKMFATWNELGYGRVVMGMNIAGLNSPPETIEKLYVKNTLCERVAIMGGIFRMAPMGLMRYFRWDERLPMGMGEARQFANFCAASGIRLMRVTTVHATHGESTLNQEVNSSWAYEHDVLQFIPLGL